MGVWSYDFVEAQTHDEPQAQAHDVDRRVYSLSPFAMDTFAGFVAAIESGDGLAAALHTPAWARLHLDDARLLLLYSRHDFVQGDWPKTLKRGVPDQAQRL